MRSDSESILSAMKGPHYERITSKLRGDLEQITDVETALSIALCTISRAARAEAGTLWFYDKYGDGKIRAKVCCGGVDLRGFVLEPGEGIAGQVIDSSKSIIVEDCQSDPRWKYKVDEKTGFKTMSMICVPLIWKDHSFGCIQIINKMDGGYFDEQDFSFVQNLAKYISEVFRKNNILNNYEEGVEVTPKVLDEIVEPTFERIFETDSFADVEYDLMGSNRFSQLPENAQKNVLRHMREIWILLQKNPSENKQKSRKKLVLFGRKE